MTGLGSDYTGCDIIIYDETGDHISSTKVISYDKKALRMEVLEMPPELGVGSVCKLLILTSTTPCEYQGRVVRGSTKRVIALYYGHEKESRWTERYKVSSPAQIEYLIFEGKAYPLHTPLSIEIINISKSGLRFIAKYYTMSDGDRFQMRMKISDNDKLFIADVVNHQDRSSSHSEYGCCLLAGLSKVGLQ